jgi:glycosyltransferase involved in cell wall biosynthesis/GT2 family glycosyltransferase
MISEQGDGLVFLLGVPRSGTTLLATMLAQHPQVVSPPEPWLMLALEALGQTPLDHPADPQLIGEAVLKFASDTAKIDAARAYALSIYNRILKDAARSVLIDKTPRYYLVLPYLKQLFPNAKFLWIRRNPLDVAASFKNTWKVDLAADLRLSSANRGCMDLVLGSKILADFADSDSPPVHRIAYEQLVAEPERLAAEAVAFLGLEPAEHLTHFELQDSALAKSDFGDRKIMQTQSPHAQSVGKWKTEFTAEDLRILVDAVGAPLFRRLGYESVLSRLEQLGVATPSVEATAILQRQIEARYAERVASVQAVCTLRGTGLPGPPAKDLASLFSNPFVSLMVEVNGWQQKILDLRKEMSALNDRTAAAEALAQEKVKQLEGTVARMRGLEGDLAEANNVARKLRDELANASNTTAGAVSALDRTSLFAGAGVSAPDVVRAPGADLSYCPSWSGTSGMINDEHAGIYDATKDLPGWQDPPDSFKLYEMAYHSGSVILEIGVYGGRSAVVELRAALHAQADKGGSKPQFYGVDLDPAAIPRSLKSLRDAAIDPYCLLYHGTLKDFHRDIPITPTMVFVDGDHSYEGVLADLALLATFIAPGTPVMCHDYGGLPDVKRGVDEAIATGSYEMMGTFAGSILLRGSTMCAGIAHGLAHRTFEQVRDALLKVYLAPEVTETSSVNYAANRQNTFIARQELRIGSDVAGSSGRGQWPEVRPSSEPLPPTLSNGKPWPKISIVTPTLNQGKFIERTILSVLNQEYPNVEYIVMDGGSIDETLSILARYSHRVRVISEKDSGQSNAINKGFGLCTGELFTWLNSDDMFAPDALAGMVLAFHTSGADIVAGVCQVQKNGTVLNRHMTTCGDGSLSLDDLLDLDGIWMQGQFFYQPEVMFTRALWEKAGGHVDESLHYSMDYELWLRFAACGATLHPIGRIIALFGVHAEQKTSDVANFLPELRKVRDAFVARTGHAAPRSRPAPTKNRMRVVFFNDLGFIVGAGIAHQRLAAALSMAGCEIVPVAISPDVIPARITTDQITEAIEIHSPDLVVIGNIHGASLSPSVIGAISSRWRTVQVVHDLWLLTGRCAYNGDCEKYIAGCDDSCPTPHEYPALAPSKIHPAWEAKQELMLSPTAPILAGLSSWTTDFIKRRFPHLATRARPGLITARCGLPEEFFHAPDWRAARQWLGLPADKFIILFSASNLSDKRKGLTRLLEALHMLQLPDVLAVCIGVMDTGGLNNGVPIRSLGYIAEPAELAMCYAAADLFVSPSSMETFGQTFIEAAACGTPSVGFFVGGVPEALVDGVSGRVVTSVTSRALAEAIEELHQNPALRQRIRAWGKLWAANEWSLRSAAQRFLSQLNSIGMLTQLGVAPKTGFAPDAGSVPNPIYLDMQEAQRSPAHSNGGAMVQARVARLEAERDQLQARIRQITGTRLWRMVSTVYPTYYRTIHAPYVPNWLRGIVQRGVSGLGNDPPAKKAENGRAEARRHEGT